MKTVAIIQARMSSSRLPGKSLMKLAGKPVLDWTVDAARAITGVDEVVVATSVDGSDDAIAAHCASARIKVFRGDLNDVLARFYHAAKEYRADRVIRLTADCPFLDPAVCSTILTLLDKTGADYASNAMVPTWPDGLDCEVFRMEALEEAYRNAKLPSHREHVTQYIHQNRFRFKTANYHCPIPGLESERWTLDRQQDFELLSRIAGQLKHKPVQFTEVLEILAKNAELRKWNRDVPPNEGLTKSKGQDRRERMPRSYERSKEMLARAEKVTPLGSQTFSKSRTQYPPGYAPLYVTHGLGGRIWDVDGNEYVDMVNALLPNVLGYADPDVDFAIRSQMDNGITMSLATELEVTLAEKLVDLIPCAESVRFGKNGSDATTACIRLARAFTGKDRVIACGYHGWQDWYIGSTTINRGVPQTVQQLTHSAPYNDLDAVESLLKKHPGEFAALIMEPMNFVEPIPNYHADLQKLLKKHDVLFVFDEVITGFRYAMGGAQEYFGVTPDLASFGKSMGNGMPIAAVVGRKDIFDLMDRVFISTTFGGETLSLAASLAVIEKMEKQNVIERLWKTGERISLAVTGLVKSHGLQNAFQIKGKAPWHTLAMQAIEGNPVEAIKTFMIVELCANGMLTHGNHNICFAHSEDDITAVVDAYGIVFDKLKTALAKGPLEKQLAAPVIKPLFKVR